MNKIIEINILLLHLNKLIVDLVDFVEKLYSINVQKLHIPNLIFLYCTTNYHCLISFLYSLHISLRFVLLIR